MLILAPNGVVLNQWLAAIYRSFLDLAILLIHGERPLSVKFAAGWIPIHAITATLTNLQYWPLNLPYIFDLANARALRAVILSTYNTFLRKTIVTISKPRTLSGKPPKKMYVSNWKGVVGTAVFDKGHKLCHPSTRAYAAVKLLRAETLWFLTATPVVNSSQVS